MNSKQAIQNNNNEEESGIIIKNKNNPLMQSHLQVFPNSQLGTQQPATSYLSSQPMALPACKYISLREAQGSLNLNHNQTGAIFGLEHQIQRQFNEIDNNSINLLPRQKKTNSLISEPIQQKIKQQQSSLYQEQYLSQTQLNIQSKQKTQPIEEDNNVNSNDVFKTELDFDDYQNHLFQHNAKDIQIKNIFDDIYDNIDNNNHLNKIKINAFPAGMPYNQSPQPLSINKKHKIQKIQKKIRKTKKQLICLTQSQNYQHSKNIKDLARRNLRANFAADIIQFIQHLKQMLKTKCLHDQNTSQYNLFSSNSLYLNNSTLNLQLITDPPNNYCPNCFKINQYEELIAFLSTKKNKLNSIKIWRQCWEDKKHGRFFKRITRTYFNRSYAISYVLNSKIRQEYKPYYLEAIQFFIKGTKQNYSSYFNKLKQI